MSWKRPLQFTALDEHLVTHLLCTCCDLHELNARQSKRPLANSGLRQVVECAVTQLTNL